MSKKASLLMAATLQLLMFGFAAALLPNAAAAQSPHPQGDVITPTHRVYLPLIEHTPPSLLVSHGHGFDTCAAPTIEQLAAWRQASPYEYLGIYLGGVMHYAPCKSYNLQYQTPQWLAQARAQGWQFIPTWVGPQAPCSSLNTRLSDDLPTAAAEGTLEARQAITAATALGLRSPLIIYYDMEYYNINDTACHSAVKTFLDGWVGELHRQGHQAGIYSVGSAIDSWYTLNNPPDSTWGAWYTRPDYDPFITVDYLNQNFVNPAYWSHHRLFQYSGSHTESWDGVALNVDNNAAAGLVALGDESNSVAISLREAQLVSPATGWLWLGQQLYLTQDGGNRWENITPAQVDDLLGVYFWDERRGWLAAVDAAAGQPALWRTIDSGQSWQQLPALPQIEQPLGAVSLDFVSEDRGWLLAELDGGLNFSRGRLFQTTDGGQSWVEMAAPLGGEINFVSAEVGWLVGGPTRSELLRSGDGGQTWQPVSAAPNWGDALPAYALPVFGDAQNGAVAVTVSQPGASRVEIYTTSDGGNSWQLAETAPLAQATGPGTRAAGQVIEPQQWWLAATSPTAPAHTSAVSFATPEIGWAVTRHNACTAAGCTRAVGLHRTLNSGQTWAAVGLPQ